MEPVASTAETLAASMGASSPEYARPWPDAFDWGVMIFFGSGILTLLIFGFWYWAIDLRACYRAWRKVLIIVRDYLTHIPNWAKHRTPRCLATFGLALPCSQQELLQAYRALVKTRHPDVGGDLREFKRLQTDFEQARRFLEELQQPVEAA